MDKQKMANNILEFLIDPTRIAPKDRLYFRPEEILRNEVYESAKADSRSAYRGQDQNADFYPIRNRELATRKEGSIMDRRTLIASLDILSKNFREGDPIAKDLRTMAYAVSRMADGELSRRLAEQAPDFDGLAVEAKAETFECPKCGSKVLKQTGFCVKCKTKVKPKKASEEIEDTWSKEAADAVAAALLFDVKGVKAKKNDKKDDEMWAEESKKKKEEMWAEEEDTEKPKESKQKYTAEESKEAGKKKGPGIPDGTGPASETGECPVKKEEASEESKESEEDVEAKGCGTKPDDKDAEENKKADSEVNTEVLSSDVEIDGVQFDMNSVSADEIELSDSDRNQLDSLFKQGEMEEADKERFDQLFK